MKNAIRPPIRIDVNERVIPPHDKTTKVWRWRLNVPASITGTRKERLFFGTEKEAKKHAEELLAARRAGGDLTEKLKARGLSFTDAITYALRHAPKAKPVTIATAIEQFIASRKSANCKERYLANLESQLGQVREDFGSTMIDAVTKTQLERFLADLTGKDGETPATPKSRINYIITLNALFNFAVGEGWRGENPAVKIRRPNLDEVATAILSPAQAKQLLDEACKPAYADVFPVLLIQLFAGPRRSELPHITWETIRDSYLRLDTTKVRVKRPVELPGVLLEWLAPYRGKGRMFAPEAAEFNAKDTRPVEDAYTYRLGEIAAAAKLTLPKNVLRHSAITYRVNSTGDIAGTALWAGTSVEVIREHYLGAATKKDAATFYALKPGSQANVVPMRSAS